MGLYIGLFHLTSIRFFCMRGKDGGDMHNPNKFDVALCGITVKEIALRF